MSGSDYGRLLREFAGNVERVAVLMIEDNPIDALLLKTILKHSYQAYFDVFHATTMAEAEGSLKNSPFDIILADLSLPDSEGIETVERVHILAPEIPIVVLTSIDDASVGLQAVQAGAQDYLIKGQIESGLLTRSILYSIERNRMQVKARNLSLKDDLTGLYNRRGFLEFAEQHVRLAQRNVRTLLLIFADLDKLKTINDTFGHREGDEAIKAAAAILNATFRRSDIIARIGGDEFTVLAIDASMEGGEIMISALEQNIRRHNEQSEAPYNISLSTGTALFDPTRPCSIEELMERADRALYKQKHKRRSPVHSPEHWRVDATLAQNWIGR
jgi:diguanylate cyclase (GGDEF)-like protein